MAVVFVTSVKEVIFSLAFVFSVCLFVCVQDNYCTDLKEIFGQHGQVTDF